jgi:tetratricopeptide (TPR) repeat protein
MFTRIASKPRHVSRTNTLEWFAKLDTHLPEPADIIGSVGKFKRSDIQRFDNDSQRSIYHQLSFMMGKHRYRERRFVDAIRLFKAVHESSPYYVKAQFTLGISNVQLRKSVPAVKAFRRILNALNDGVEGVEDEDRMKDLANLSLARVYYSASVELDEGNRPSINAVKLTAAVNHWNRVDSASEYWLDALFEQSWAYYMAGRFPRALGNIHTLQSPYFPNAYYPEADVVRMVIYFTTCQYDDATSLVAKFQRRYEPIAKELQVLLERFDGEDGDEKMFRFLRNVRRGSAKLKPRVQTIVEGMLGDRQLLRNVAYVSELDEERTRFSKAPATFRSSALGESVDSSIDTARSTAVRRTGTLARRRYQRTLDDLQEHLRSGQKVIVDITKEQREELDLKIERNKDKWGPDDAYTFGRVEADEEHVIWPFDGEYWRDELGFYRQVVSSRCGSGKPD